MAVINQDFVTFKGDTVQPVFAVVDGNNNPVDISTVTDITWTARRNITDAVAITKLKSTGGIVFTNTGTDGKFTLKLAPADTSPLSDWYIHQASITDASGNVTTVTIGRMNVGLPPNWTFVPSLVGVESLYTVRRLIGDVVQSDPLLSDQEVLWAIGQYTNEWLAAAECCRNISSFYARQVDLVEGQLKNNYSQRSKRYSQLAVELEQRGFTRSGAAPYVGGTSLTDKNNQVENTDRTPPQFVIGMFDNLLPESPVGHQTGAGQGLPTVDNAGSPTVAGGP